MENFNQVLYQAPSDILGFSKQFSRPLSYYYLFFSELAFLEKAIMLLLDEKNNFCQVLTYWKVKFSTANDTKRQTK